MMSFLMVVCSSLIYSVSCAREYAFYQDGDNVESTAGSSDNWDPTFVSTKCEENGMKAARIESDEDQAAANALCFSRTQGSTWCWFGLGRTNGGAFHWQDDGEELGSYTYWDTNQPGTGEGCAGIWTVNQGDYGYKWHDGGCNYQAPLICEVITACGALEIDGFLDHCSENYASMLVDINTKAAQSTLDDEIATINTALGTKADQTALDSEIATVNTGLAAKADTSVLNGQVTTINGEITTINGQIAAINEHLALLQGSGFGAQAIGGGLIDDGKATSWIDNNTFVLISLGTNIVLIILAISLFCFAVRSKHRGKYNKVSSYIESSDTDAFKLNA